MLGICLKFGAWDLVLMKIINRRAYHDFQILDRLEAGIKLTGSEVKSVKGGRIKLEGAFVKIQGSEGYLVNAQISPYPFARQEDYDPARTRKLLLHKKEIIALKSKMAQKNLTIVPLSCYTKDNLVKIELGLVKGKKKWEKREAKKRRDLEREVERELRGKI